MSKKQETGKREASHMNGEAAGRIVLVATYKGDQLVRWRGWYNYPITDADKITEADAKRITELWLFKEQKVCAPIAEYSRAAAAQLRDAAVNESDAPIRVVELFAGVGGFRIGLERASNRFETVWNDFAIAS